LRARVDNLADRRYKTLIGFPRAATLGLDRPRLGSPLSASNRERAAHRTGGNIADGD
jgi:hypothetical protein